MPRPTLSWIEPAHYKRRLRKARQRPQQRAICLLIEEARVKEREKARGARPTRNRAEHIHTLPRVKHKKAPRVAQAYTLENQDLMRLLD
jgi:hypothetical protein